jgi:signal transduction histidine kinase/PAS domain-containing protein
MSSMKTRREETTADAKPVELLRLQLERCQRELEVCRLRMGELEQGEALLAGENRLLEMVAKGEALPSILDGICRLVEEISSGSLCSILLLDANGDRLWHGAAPSLPASYIGAFGGRTIGPKTGPCGRAVYFGKPVIVCDIAADPLGDDYRDLALAHGLQACWSTPIFSSQGKVLGSFAVLSREPRSPTPQHEKIIAQVTHLAAVAIERKHTEQELRRSEAYLAEAQGLSLTGSFGWNVSTGEIIWSKETYCILGYDRTVKPNLNLVLDRVPSEDRALVQKIIDRATRDGADLDFGHRLLMPDGIVKHVHIVARATKAESGGIEFVGAVMDVTEQKRAEAFVAGEKRLLEMIARGSGLALVLDALCRFSEEMSDNVLVSILLVSPDRKSLRHGAAPSLPKSYTEAIDGGLIGPRAGSCGTAASRGERVIVSDIATDPLWDQYRHLAIEHGLRACWSTPIFSTTRDVMGTFALYSREPHSPTPEQLNLIEQMTHVAAVAIERERAAEALLASEHLARGQLEALTGTLAALSRESDPDRLLEHVLRTIVEQTKAHSIAAWNRNEDGARFDMIAIIENGRYQTREEAVHPAGRLSMLPQHHPVWREVLRTGQHGMMEDIDQASTRMCVGFGDWHRVVEDIDPDPAFTVLMNHLREMDVRAVLFVPILVAGQVAGTLAVRFQEKRTFRREEIELTRALAHQAMLAIQLMHLSQQRRQAAVIAERNRMARDIHDTLAQGFTGVIMQLEAAKGAIAQNSLAEATDRVERAGDMARVGLGEARRSVLALRPRSLQNTSLCMALDDLLKRMTNGSDLQAEFHLEGDEPAMPAEWEEGLLRVAQEFLTNTIKHAKAKNFRATLTIGAKEIQFRLVDDGSGFDLHAEHEGFGLLGMKERVDQMGGQFILRSMPGQGTEIQIILNNSAKQKLDDGGEHA